MTAPSASGTVVNTVGPILYDASGEPFALTGPTNNYTITENDVADTGISNVTQILYYNNLVYAQVSGAYWWYKAVSTAAWIGPISDPRQTGAPSAAGTVVNTAGPVLYDIAGEAFSLAADPFATSFSTAFGIGAVASAPYFVVFNGITADTTISNVSQLLYYNTKVWAQVSGASWYSKPIASYAWSGPSTDPRHLNGGLTDTATSSDALVNADFGNGPAQAAFTVADTVASSDLWSVAVQTPALADTVASSDALKAVGYGLKIADTASTAAAFSVGTLSPFSADFSADFGNGPAASGFFIIADTTTTSDRVVALGFVASLTDTAASSDLLFGTALGDTAVTSDAMAAAGYGFVLADTTASTDALSIISAAGAYAAALTATATTSDGLSFLAAAVSLADTAFASDALPQVGISLTDPFSGSFSSAFGGGTSLVVLGTFADIATTQDSVTPIGLLGALSGTATTSDGFVATAFGVHLTDTATTSDGVLAGGSALALHDTTYTSDALSVLGSSLAVADTASSSDLLTAFSFNLATIAVSAATSDALTSAAGLRLPTDTTATSDALVETGAAFATLADTVASSDVVAPSAFAVSLADTAATSDVLATAGFGRYFADTAATSDSLSAATFGLALTDTAASADALVATAVSQTVADSVATSDTLATVGLGLPQADTAYTADTLSVTAFGVTLADTASTADAVQSAIFATGLVDTAASSDAWIGAFAATGVSADTAATSDALSAAAVFPVALTDSAATNDAQTEGAEAAAVLTDDAATSDTTNNGAPGTAILDYLATSDAVTNSGAGTAFPTDGAITSDAWTVTAISVSPLYLVNTETQTITALRAFLEQVLPTGTEIFRTEINRVPEPKGANYVAMTPIGRVRLSTNVVTYADYYPTPYGSRSSTQPTQVTVQLDVHGPSSADNAQIITTLLRDAYSCLVFSGINPAIQPLYAEDPRQMVFDNGENQMEVRWVIDVVLQVNQTVTTTQDFAGGINVGLVNVDAQYPEGVT